MIRPLAVVVALAAFVPLTASVATADVHLVGGSVDTTDTAVGQVMAGSAACSGILIAPTIVLTAAHCVTTTPVTVVLDDGDYTVTTVTTQPEFNTPSPLDSDLATLVLDHASTITPLPFATSVVAADDDVTLVAFGSDTGITSRQSLGATVAVVNGASFEIDQTQNACTDDAGGAVLTGSGSTAAIVGVISSASTPCGTASYHVRTAAYLPWLAKVAPGATVVGGGALPTTDLPPTLIIERPGDGATMPVTFRLDVRVGDDYGALGVSATIDGSDAGATTVTSALVAVALTFTPGDHTVVATVNDASGNTTSATISLTIESPTYSPGASGAACWDATDCTSAICSIYDDQRFCTNACSNDDACPLNMYCNTATMLCIRGSDAGCCEASSAPPPWLAGGIVLLGWIAVARRRRA